MSARNLEVLTVLALALSVAPVQAERGGRPGSDRSDPGVHAPGRSRRAHETHPGRGRPAWARPGTMAPGRKVVMVPEEVIAEPRGRPALKPPVMIALPASRPAPVVVVPARRPVVVAPPPVVVHRPPPVVVHRPPPVIVHRPPPVVVAPPPVVCEVPAPPPPPVCTIPEIVVPVPAPQPRTQVEKAKVHTRNTLLALGLANEALNDGGKDKVRVRNASLGLLVLNELLR